MRVSLTSKNLSIRKNLSTDKLFKTVYEQLKTAWRASARAFFKEVAAHIAIDTGMSRASLLPLAGKVRIASEVRKYLSDSTGFKRGWTDIEGNYHPEGFRSRARGESEARKRLGTAQEISFGSLQSPSFVFYFEIVIYQWELHENKWRALDAGREAFEKTLPVELAKRIRSQDIINYMLTGRLINRGE